MRRRDIIIVGGGPAGSTCARQLRRPGADVLVLDKAEFPREKLCAGWITPRCARDLELADYPHSFVTFRRFLVHYRGWRVPLRTRQYSIRRRELDDWLLRHAGVDVETHEVRRIARTNSGFEIDDAYACRVLVGAGGTGCPVQRSLFRDAVARPREARIAAMEAEFPYPWSDPNCHLWFCDDGLPGYAWYVPKGGEVVNIGIGGYQSRMAARDKNILDHWRGFLARLDADGFVRGADAQGKGYRYYLNAGVRNVSDCGAYLVGDAAGLATRDLGEGIGPAVESAIRAAVAIRYTRELDLRGITRYSLPGMLAAGLGFGWHR